MSSQPHCSSERLTVLANPHLVLRWARCCVSLCIGPAMVGKDQRKRTYLIFCKKRKVRL